MGLTYVRAGIARSRGGPWRTVRLLADTGAYYTVLRRRTLAAVGVRPVGKEKFRLGDGRVIERDLGEVYVRCERRIAPTQVVFGGPGDVAVLGVLTLEELSLEVDPTTRRLRVRKELPLLPIVV